MSMQHRHPGRKGQVNGLLLNILHAEILNSQPHDLTAIEVLAIQCHGQPSREIVGGNESGLGHVATLYAIAQGSA